MKNENHECDWIAIREYKWNLILNIFFVVVLNAFRRELLLVGWTADRSNHQLLIPEQCILVLDRRSNVGPSVSEVASNFTYIEVHLQPRALSDRILDLFSQRGVRQHKRYETLPWFSKSCWSQTLNARTIWAFADVQALVHLLHVYVHSYTYGV